MLLLILLTLLGRPSHSCFCAIPEVTESFAQADAVFIGKVVDIVKPKTFDAKAPLSDRLYTIRFKVEKSWKGEPSTEKSVLTAQGEFGCFAYPAVGKGERYLVYGDPAYDDDVKLKGVLAISSCNRTALLPLPGLRLISRLDLSDYNQRDGYEDLKKLEEISTNPFLKRSF